MRSFYRSSRLPILVALVALSSLVGCDKIKSMVEGKLQQASRDAVQQAGSAAPGSAAVAVIPTPIPTPIPVPVAPPAGNEEEKGRYIAAAAASACAAAKEPTRAVDAANEALRASGFADPLAYAEAGRRYLSDPAVAQAISAKRAECLAVAVPTPPVVPAKEEVKVEEPKKEEAKPEEAKEEPELAGKWSGKLMGTNSGDLSFTVGANNSTVSGGKLSGSGFSGDFAGTISGNKVNLNGKGGRGISVMLKGQINPKTGKASGDWRGTINNRRGEGSWTATHAK